MELLPVIYNSLIIAAGLFVITVAISYVSYKIKSKNGSDNVTIKPSERQSVKDSKGELKPKYKSPPPQRKITKEEYGQRDQRKKVEERERHKERNRRREEKPRDVERSKPSERRKEYENKRESRIEIVKDISKSHIDEDQPKFEKPKQKKETKEEVKRKKKLKSIDDDPLKKYTDSHDDDDFHTLKTDD